MTPTAQNIALATHLGWTEIENKNGFISGVRPNETRTWAVASAFTLQKPVLARGAVPD